MRSSLAFCTLLPSCLALTCGLQQLVIGEDALHDCSVLDLQGELLESDVFGAANTTLNASIHVLTAAIADNHSMIETLLLSSNPILSDEYHLQRLSYAVALNQRLRHLALDACNLSSAVVELTAPM